MKFRPVKIVFLILLPVFSCADKESGGDQEKLSLQADSLGIAYAKGFSAVQENGIWHLTIHSPYPDADRSFSYLLVPDGMKIPSHAPSVQVIRTPVRKLAATSTTHIPLLDYLDETSALAAFPHPDYISSAAARSRIDSGKVKDIGTDHAMDPETILSVSPDLIMAYSMSADLGQLERLREAGVPYLLNADYLEAHPLGRAEWIKVAGLLFGKEKMADSVFQVIAKNYTDLEASAAKATEKPTALSGVVYGDTWFMPGGKNYAARLMQDAGINYMWLDNPSGGFLELSLESVLKKAQQAGLWIGVANFASLEEMADTEPRYSAFRAFREENVWSYTRRIGPTGGNEYLESGYLRPDLILGDLIAIAHPELVPGHEMYFYKQLK